MSKPIVSLCIPTKNESQRLKNTITSIIAEKCFMNGELELVISDNCSDDDTEAVCREYAEKYENIVYNRNETDIKDRNFPKVMIREKVFEAYKDKPYFNEYIEFYVAVLKKQTYNMMVELQKKLDDK